MFTVFIRKNNILLITAFIISFIFAIMFVIRPSIIGYIMYEKIKSSNYTLKDYGANIQELQTRLLVYSTNLSACNEFIKELTPALENSFNKFSECQDELTALEINFNLTKNKYQESIENYEKKLEELSKNIEEKSKEINKIKDEKESEINQLKTHYNLLAQNTANNLCCKAKIDNPKIRYYKIENDKVICLEEGTLVISC